MPWSYVCVCFPTRLGYTPPPSPWLISTQSYKCIFFFFSTHVFFFPIFFFFPTGARSRCWGGHLDLCGAKHASAIAEGRFQERRWQRRRRWRQRANTDTGDFFLFICSRVCCGCGGSCCCCCGAFAVAAAAVVSMVAVAVVVFRCCCFCCCGCFVFAAVTFCGC